MNAANLPAIVVDESVDAVITEQLRSNNFHIYLVAEMQPSITDNQVLHLANQSNALLLTEDKDFGELVVQLQKEHKGILLIRLSGVPSKQKAELVCNALLQHFEDLRLSFSVLDSTKLRIRK